MKKIFKLLALCFFVYSASAQSPQALKYQAVARDNNGDLLANQNVTFRISILQGGPSGAAVYVETHSATTNDYGLATLEIGRGTLVSGDFSSINWGSDSHFLLVEMDEAGGSSYQMMGTSELLSVPYSFYAGAAPADNDWTVSGNNMYSTVSGNVGIGTASPDADLAIFSDADYQGLTLQTGNNTFSQGIRFRNSGTSYTWHIYRRDAGSNNADLVFANGASTDITTLTERVTFKNGGKVGIGTTTPARKLSVIGHIRAAAATDETKYAEIYHDGSNPFLNWSGNGNLDFRYDNTTLATVSQGNNRLYVPRPLDDFGADKSCIYGYRPGSAGIAQNGGTSWAEDGIDAAVKGYSFWGNNYTAGVAGYSYLDYPKSAGVIGAHRSGSVRAMLAYKDDNNSLWAGYFAGDVNVTGTIHGNGSGLTNLPSDDDWTVSGNNMYSGVSGKVGIGTSAPAQQLSVIGTIRGANDASETEYIEMSHGGGNAYINWNGDGDLDLRYNGTNMATVKQSGGFNISSGNAYMIGGNSILHNKGSNNLFAGYQAGLNNTGSNVTIFGYNAGITGNSGNFNTFIGSKSGQVNTTGYNNIFIGADAGQQNSSGNYNAFMGAGAGDGNKTGSENVFVGFYAGGFNDTGNNNTFLGFQAGLNTANQSGNIFIGHNAGSNESGSNLLFIDNSNTASPLIWGDFANNRLVINGNNSNNTLLCTFFSNGSAGGTTPWQFVSDETLKQNIQNIPNALEKVRQLRGVNFEFKSKENFPAGKQMGFIAQEAQKVIPEVVVEGDGMYGMAYAPITALLVEAVKEQQKIIEQLQSEIDELKISINK